MYIDQLNSIDCLLLGALTLCFLVQLYFYVRYLLAPARKIRRDRKSSTSNLQSSFPETPPVSVILCAHNESDNLSAYLQALLLQDYPEYEVIVVDDGSDDNSREIVEAYMVRDPRLHLTFVPSGARVQSTKKLAITLAAKAAQYDYLLLTDADCVPESPHWIASMMAGFKNPQTQIVLGFGAYFSEPKHINRLVQYDTLFNGLHYLGAALCGHPYMGVGRNLAYRKSFFFESGGFTHLMTNRAGDDDLFVNHVATRANTEVVVLPESYTWSPAKKSLKEWLLQKRRHLSVSHAYRTETKFRLSIEPMTRGLFYMLFIAALVYYQLSLYALVALGIFLLRWILQTTVLNLSARRMGLKRLNPFSILWFDIALPLINLWMLIIPKKYKW